MFTSNATRDKSLIIAFASGSACSSVRRPYLTTLATSFRPAGSGKLAETIGIVVVARWHATAAIPAAEDQARQAYDLAPAWRRCRVARASPQTPRDPHGTRSRQARSRHTTICRTGRLAKETRPTELALALCVQIAQVASLIPRLRHTHASALIAAGLDVVVISRRLGHRSPHVTLRIYGHLFKRDDSAAARAIEAAMRTRNEPSGS